MATLLQARPLRDETEDAPVRQLARSRHAPADWVWHAKMIGRSWRAARASVLVTRDIEKMLPHLSDAAGGRGATHIVSHAASVRPRSRLPAAPPAWASSWRMARGWLEDRRGLVRAGPGRPHPSPATVPASEGQPGSVTPVTVGPSNRESEYLL
jgi:hypothetical protein